MRKAEFALKGGVAQLDAAHGKKVPMLEHYLWELRQQCMRLEQKYNLARSCSVFRVWKQEWAEADQEKNEKDPGPCMQ